MSFLITKAIETLIVWYFVERELASGKEAIGTKEEKKDGTAKG